eukprot:CAMPEP_0202809698 /NCGR_PEP_ID=MMETSP1389-20130828/1965_1 /ASSEMBLY_ACC=CAM_ASM_000865 /TAXON_ID=302021 /ORGANISM="Rhodomonas sp., Strain CCMP768" /LENGTH=159 /DNA_ID=CAMNT_0049480389 /DNA_START=129 /DNA_END=605 /DNA_ORIENTATION=+
MASSVSATFLRAFLVMCFLASGQSFAPITAPHALRPPQHQSDERIISIVSPQPQIHSTSSVCQVGRIGGTYQVFVKTVSGKTLAVNVDASDTIQAVKSKVFALEGIPVTDQKLHFSGRALEDKRKLLDYHVTSESTLFLAPKVKGGMQVFVKTLTGKTI